MKNNDARVRYTQKVLKDSLLQLLEKKPINKITVKEVCELAELNRATFYAHYTDCFDLLESIENEMLGGFEESLKYIRSLDVTSLMSAIYEMIERNDNACRVLVFHGCDHKILGKMIGKKHRLLARRVEACHRGRAGYALYPSFKRVASCCGGRLRQIQPRGAVGIHQ